MTPKLETNIQYSAPTILICIHDHSNSKSRQTESIIHNVSLNIPFVVVVQYKSTSAVNRRMIGMNLRHFRCQHIYLFA